jgi:transposase
MMGEQSRSESLFYYFRLEEQIPEDHLLRLLDRYIDFSFVRERLKTFYSSTGRPSIDPEVLMRLLLVGYLYGITSERRLLDEVRMHLAYRWFTRLDFNAEIPDHSTFSKNRHGRFRQSGVFREVFEEIVRRCVEAGLVKGETLAVDGTMVAADASRHSRIRREELRDAAQVLRTVQQYLAELEQANPVANPALVSTTDPDALLATKGGGSVRMAYYDNYLIDTSSRVILEVEATPALFHQETAAARRMMEGIEKLGLRPKHLAADKAYGSGEFLAWLMARGVEPHIPVIAQSRITDLNFDTQTVQFSAKDKYSGKRIQIRCSVEKLIDLWAQHILKRYRHAVRYFGLFAPRTVNQMFDRIFDAIGYKRQPGPTPPRWAESIKEMTGRDPRLEDRQANGLGAPPWRRRSRGSG